MLSILCFTFYVLCFMFYVLFFMFCVLCFMFYVLILHLYCIYVAYLHMANVDIKKYKCFLKGVTTDTQTHTHTFQLTGTVRTTYGLSKNRPKTYKLDQNTKTPKH